MAYLIDTDALVHIRDRPNSEAVYAALIPLCRQGLILTVSQVYDEMKRFPEVRNLFWPLRQSMKVNQDTMEVFQTVGYISEEFGFLYDLSGTKNPDPADPWLIACAKVYGYTLITDERKNSGVKIPFVCKQQSIQVDCKNGLEMLAELGL